MDLAALQSIAQSAAHQLKEIAFFKYGFPLLTLVGGLVFFYYGVKGIVKKSTIGLGRTVGGSQTQTVEITGVAAQIAGVLYICCGVCISVGLGLVSYYMFLG